MFLPHLVFMKDIKQVLCYFTHNPPFVVPFNLFDIKYIIYFEASEVTVGHTELISLILQVTNRIWRWFDLSTGKWNTYSSSNNKLINDAYWNGDSMVRVTCGRRRYMIQLGALSQVSLIIFCLIDSNNNSGSFN